MNRQQYMRMLPLAMVANLLVGVSNVASGEPIKVVVPNSLAEQEGPTDGDVSNFGPFRQQQLFLATEFGSLPQTHHAITGFYARPDYTVTIPSSATYDDLTMRVSTTTASGLNSVFADNHGADVTTVFQGPLTISTQAQGDLEGPRNFDYYFPFSTPFPYDPAPGNLVVEISSNSGPAGNLVVDAFFGALDGFVAASGANATAGDIGNRAAVTQFVFVPFLEGDYNNNGVVDAADYTVWRGLLGQAVAMPNESVTLGSVTPEDYDVWKSHFGATSGGSAPDAAVPEPVGILPMLAAVAVIGLWCRGRRRIRVILRRHAVRQLAGERPRQRFD